MKNINKFKVLGVMLMAAIILNIYASYRLGFMSMDWITASRTNFLLTLSLLSITLFGSVAALTLDILSI